MKPDTSRKNVEQSLNVWAQAEQSQQSVLSNEYGDIHLVYASLPKQDPEREIRKKRKAVLSMIGKIQNELRDFSAKTGIESVEQLLMRLPSLGRFSASGKLGNLREEWLHLRKYQTDRLADLASKRQKIFSEFSQHLPQMPTHFEADGTAILRNDFESTEQKKRIKQEIEAVNNYKLNSKGLYQTFEDDLPRTKWSIEIDGAIQFFEKGKKEEKLEAIKKACGDDQLTLSTVSKLMNQAAPGLVMVANNDIYPRNNRIFIKHERDYGEPTFLHISRKDNHIYFEARTYSKSIDVELNADENSKGGQIWPVNRDEKWKGSLGPNNYGQHYRLAIQIDKQAASHGILKPSDGTQIEATYEIRLCPALHPPKI